jgi:hypothetical protein
MLLLINTTLTISMVFPEIFHDSLSVPNWYIPENFWAQCSAAFSSCISHKIAASYEITCHGFLNAIMPYLTFLSSVSQLVCHVPLMGLDSQVGGM